MCWKSCIWLINSLWPNDAIWRHKSRSTLAQVMACCLTAPSHYLNQCWLIFSKVQWHSVEGNLTRDSSPSITKISLKITCLKFYSNLPGANEVIAINHTLKMKKKSKHMQKNKKLRPYKMQMHWCNDYLLNPEPLWCKLYVSDICLSGLEHIRGFLRLASMDVFKCNIYET